MGRDADLTRRRLLIRLATVGGSTALGLGLGELVARIAAPPHPMMRLLEENLGDTAKGQFLELIESDPELFWRLAPNVTLPDDNELFFGVISNGEGLREAAEIPRRKEDGEVRLLFLGDSCTFGYRLSLADTFVKRAENALRTRFPRAKVTCINAGVPGYTVFQGWRFLETRGARYEPDLVVLNFDWNSQAIWDGLSDLQHYENLQAAQPVGFLQHSRLCQLIWDAAAPDLRPGPGTPLPRLLPAQFRSILEQARETCRRLGAETLVLVGGGRFNVEPGVDRSIRSAYQVEQLRFASGVSLGGAPALVDGVRIVQQMARSHAPSELFLDATHPTALVSERWGQAVADRVEPWLRSVLAPAPA